MNSRYKRKSKASSILGDAAEISSKIPWWAALLFGAFGFALFAIVVPNVLLAQLESSQDGNAYLVLETIIGRRIHWFGWLGIACGLVGIYYGVRNYYFGSSAGKDENKLVSLLARILGKRID